MAMLRFFKLNKHKEFNYMPLFYDKEKEEFNERVRRIEEEMGIKKPTEFTSGIRRGTMRDHIQNSRKQNKYSSLRLIAIVIILLALAYLLILR